MIALYDVSVATLVLLGLAFLVCWNAARLNRAALLWGVAHLALAGAAFWGYRFQLQSSPWMGAVSTLLTALFLVTLHGATEYLRRRAAPRWYCALWGWLCSSPLSALPATTRPAACWCRF